MSTAFIAFLAIFELKVAICAILIAKSAIESVMKHE